MRPQTEVIREIERNLKALKQNKGIPPEEGLDSKWTKRVDEEPKRFINPDLTIQDEALINFRRNEIFVLDVPNFDPYSFDLRNILGGGRRGSLQILKDDLAVLKKYGDQGLLKKYPSTKAGNPHNYHLDGYTFTYRWIRQVYYLKLFKDILAPQVRNDFVALDIGCAYGIYPYVLRREFPKSHIILLDFTGQLVMAHYFLAMSFPEARIAGFEAVSQLDKYDRAFFEKYDFILMPWFLYKNITHKSLDVVSNFSSFCEMRKKWLDYYIKGEPFESTEFFFTENRFDAAPDFDSGTTVLDYPFGDFDKLHFRISPMHSHRYKAKNFFFYRKEFFTSQCFEFIGRRKTIKS